MNVIQQLTANRLIQDAVYVELAYAIQSAHDTNEAVDAATQNLSERKAQLINDYAVDPKALGTNEDARKAKLRELCTAEHDSLELATRAKRDADLKVTLCRIKVEAADRDLRALEAIAHLTPVEWAAVGARELASA
jgi:hypothetical protein